MFIYYVIDIYYYYDYFNDYYVYLKLMLKRNVNS